MSPVLTRNQVQAADDRKVEKVLTPEWGGGDSYCFIRSLTGKQRDEFELGMLIGKGKNTEVNLRNLRAKLIILAAVDSDDLDTCNPIFQASDASWLGDKNSEILQRLYGVAQRLSGLSNEDVDEMTGTLGNDQSGDSGSDSPPTSDSQFLSANSE